MKKHKLCLRLLKFISVFLCSRLFFYLMIDVWQKYDGVKLRGKKTLSKFLPCVTICPWSAYKNRKFSFDIANFTNNSYDRRNIFWFDRNEWQIFVPLWRNKGCFYWTLLCVLLSERSYCFGSKSCSLKKNKDIIGKN